MRAPCSIGQPSSWPEERCCIHQARWFEKSQGPSFLWVFSTVTSMIYRVIFTGVLASEKRRVTLIWIMSLRHQPPTATFSLLSINNVQPSSLFALSFPPFPSPSLFFLQPSYNPSSLFTSNILYLYPLSPFIVYPISDQRGEICREIERIARLLWIDNSDSTRRKSIDTTIRSNSSSFADPVPLIYNDPTNNGTSDYSVSNSRDRPTSMIRR